MKGWFLKISDFADELLDEIDNWMVGLKKLKQCKEIGLEKLWSYNKIFN